MRSLPRGTELLEAPLHGNQGDRAPGPPSTSPQGAALAITREVGARGSSIARRVGRRLGWQVYTQELLEFLTSNESARHHVLQNIPAESAPWADAQLERLKSERLFGSNLGDMPRLILTLAAQGNVILVGRGAGYLLPRESTLHVRIVAPLEDRIAYMAQLLRRTPEEAAEYVRDRDEQRAAFLLQTFGRRAGDPHDYDVILNSQTLGEELCADLIVEGLKGKTKSDSRPGS